MKVDIQSDLIIDDFKLVNFVNLTPEESRIVRNWRNSKIIRFWMFNDELISDKEHDNFLKHLAHSKTKVYWLVKEKERSIGVIYLTRISWRHRNAYLGMYVNPGMVHKGFGKKLLHIALKIAFDFLQLHSLKLEVVEDNEIAINLYRKFGFEEEGRLREFVYKQGMWKDVIIMGIINPREKSID